MADTIGVILAGGRGKRLKPITDTIPKPLIHVAGKTLLEHAVDFVHDVGIQDIIVVGGHGSDQMKNKIQSIDSSIQFFVADWQNQNLDGFAYVLPDIKEKNVFVCNADYVFQPDTAKQVHKNLTAISVYCSYDLDADDEDVMKVKENEKKEVVDMSKQLTDFESVYTGIWYVSDDHVAEVSDVVKELLETQDKKITTVERIFLELVRRGTSVNVRDIGSADWAEIDTVDELKRARERLGG